MMPDKNAKRAKVDSPAGTKRVKGDKKEEVREHLYLYLHTSTSAPAPAPAPAPAHVGWGGQG